MPRVVSRSAVSSSNNAAPTASSSRPLRVFYCLCGEFILVCDKSLKLMAQRNTDNSYVVRCKNDAEGDACMFKLNATDSPPVFVRREKGLELQYRFHCPRCNLLVAYQTTPPPVASGQFVYVIYGALNEIQGATPAEAFEGESLSGPRMAKAVEGGA